MLTDEVRQIIDDIAEKCEFCKQNSKSKSKPSVVIQRATDFNIVVTIDLKQMGSSYILWMICSFTKFVKGPVIKNKEAESILRGLHGSWCMELGFPPVGFWKDNGLEFWNMRVEELMSKLGIKMKFSPAFSP